MHLFAIIKRSFHSRVST